MKQTIKQHAGQYVRIGLMLTGLAAASLATVAVPRAGIPDRDAFARTLGQATVSGRVTTADGSPIPGASVSVKGGSASTGTDDAGRYTLQGVPSNAVLVFSMVGMRTHEEPMNGRTVVDVVLQSGTADLDEVVVVGYGTQKKATKTGAVAQVSGEDLKAAPVVNAESSLVGRVPGVMAMNQSGEPGNDGSRILIRGRNTLDANNAGPLIVIDGIPDANGMSRIDPNDIESLSVLKDAAAAIYGSRSANGVIVITTKRGQTGEPRISYSFNQGFVTPTNLLKTADAALYSQLQNEILEAKGQPRQWTDADIEAFRRGDDPWLYPNTDWMRELFKPYSLQQKHSLSVRGGTEKARYFASLGATAQDGPLRNGASNYKQQNARINLDTKIGQYLDLRFDMAGRLERRNRPGTPANFDILRSAVKGFPNVAARYPNGLPTTGFSGGENPLVIATDETGYDKRDNWVLNGKIGGTLRIPGVEGLSLDGNFALDKTLMFRKYWSKSWTLYSWDKVTRDASGEPIVLPVQNGPQQPELAEYFAQGQVVTINGSLRYERSFGRNNLNLLAAIEQIEGLGDNFEGRRRYFLSTAVDQLFAGGDLDRSITGSGYENARRNYFGRVSYNFDEKYLFDFNWRVDGSQNFPKEHRFGFFPGVGAGWVVSSESFWNVPFVSFLKFRGSYGKLGSDAIPAFQYLSTFAYGSGTIIDDAVYPGVSQTRTPNPGIRWEVSENYNAGIELQLDGGKWSLEADWFQNNRSNILTKRLASMPIYSGITLPDENIGTSTNQGLDALVAYQNTFGEVLLKLSANMTYARNKLTFWDEAPGAPDYQRSTGKSFGAPLYYEAIGIFRDQAHVDSYGTAVWPGARPGDIIFRDVNGDGKIDDLDRIRFDQTEFPTTSFGFSIAAEWKNFDIGTLWQGAAGARQYIRTESGATYGNFALAFVEDRWTPDNPDATMPRPFDRDGDYWIDQASTFWWWKTDYLRLKTLELGYTLPQKLTKRASINNLRFFFSGQNLLTFSAVDFIDPEAPGGIAVYYPQTKVYNVGVSVGF